MKQQLTLKKSVGILWLLALIGLLALVWLALPVQEAQAGLGITPTHTSAPTDTPAPPPTDTPAPTDTPPAATPTNTPKPDDDDDDPPPPPPPTETPPAATPTTLIPSMLPTTGGNVSAPWSRMIGLGAGMILIAGLLFKGARAIQ